MFVQNAHAWGLQDPLPNVVLIWEAYEMEMMVVLRPDRM